MRTDTTRNVKEVTVGDAYVERDGTVTIWFDGCADLSVGIRITRKEARRMARLLQKVCAKGCTITGGADNENPEDEAYGVRFDIGTLDEGTDDGCVMIHGGDRGAGGTRVMVAWPLWPEDADDMADILRNTTQELREAQLQAAADAETAERALTLLKNRVSEGELTEADYAAAAGLFKSPMLRPQGRAPAEAV